MEPLRILSLFSGIGAPEKALRNLGVEYVLKGFSEIEPKAIGAYCAIHNVTEDLNVGSVADFDATSLKGQVDLVVGGSPCQSISSLGRQEGAEEGSGTTSSLLWEMVRVVRECEPSMVVWENVKNTLTATHKPVFDKYLATMEQMGYHTTYRVVSALEVGMPQRRQRLFAISMKKPHNTLEKEWNKPLKPMEQFLLPKVDEHYTITQPSMLQYLDTRHLRKIGETCGTISTKERRRSNAGYVEMEDGRPRILCERETWRLMGFEDADFEKAASTTTRFHLYKLAGNSIVVQVLEEIFKDMGLA